MTLKKIIAALSCCVLLAGVVAVLPGCGPSDEELIRQAVTAKYDKYKDAEDDLPIKDETVNLDYELVDNDWQEADEQAGLRSINNILFLKP